MLRITKLTDYAVVVLADMVLAPVELADARAARGVSERTRIPQPTVSKVLKQLARAGLVISERGKHGGYRLARPAHDITIADIIDAVEGPIGLTECSTDPSGICELEGNCPLEANWVRINVAIRRALQDITLEDMAKPLEPGLVQLKRLSNIASA